MHQLNIKERSGLVKQASKNFRLEVRVVDQTKNSKVIGFGFIKTIQHLMTILIVPVKNRMIKSVALMVKQNSSNR